MKHRCPLTYQRSNRIYTLEGLHRLSRRLERLHRFPYTAAEQRAKAAELSDKLSIQGVQPKLSARLSVTRQIFEVVERHGHYIIKPPHPDYPEVPENEDLTMHLARLAGLEVPLHGLMHAKDDSLTYFIQRFDRKGHAQKLAVEDFAQLLGETRDTKYGSSMEKVADVIDRFATFPAVEKLKLLRLVLFNFLVGNEDSHLKNFSLITRGQKVELAPTYDLVNTSIVLQNPREELALPLRGKKSRMRRVDFIEYFAVERLQLPQKVIDRILGELQAAVPRWHDWIGRSFLTAAKQKAYADLVDQRGTRLFA